MPSLQNHHCFWLSKDLTCQLCHFAVLNMQDHILYIPGLGAIFFSKVQMTSRS